VTGPTLDAATLAAAVTRHLGAGHTVAGLRRLSGGASRETWAFDAVDAAGHGHPLVLRRDPPGGGLIGASVDEFALIAAAAGAGVPVAPLRFRLGPDDDLGRGFVTDFVAGETLGRPIVHDDRYARARVGMAAELGRILATLHAVPVERTPLAAPAGPDSSATAQLDLFERLLDGYDVARPVLELALRWLRTNAVDPGRQVVVHGDFRVGNLIVDPDGIRAVLDWELAHPGEPAEDIGWLCTRSWRFGGAARVGGIGDLADLLGAYQAAGGEAIHPEQVRYWEVFGNLRWAVIAASQAFTHLQGVRRSVELAAIGRRVAETEHDLMELLV
jgi:aminoglycoside phosphotransferase (APT) family kinase protein